MEPFIGQVTLFAGGFAPRGWAIETLKRQNNHPTLKCANGGNFSTA